MSIDDMDQALPLSTQSPKSEWMQYASQLETENGQLVERYKQTLANVGSRDGLPAYGRVASTGVSMATTPIAVAVRLVGGPIWGNVAGAAVAGIAGGLGWATDSPNVAEAAHAFVRGIVIPLETIALWDHLNPWYQARWGAMKGQQPAQA